MSFADTRQVLATVLSAVPGVTGHAHRPSTPAVGDAWPVLGPWLRGAGDGFLVTWRVRVMLPQDEEAASTWLDDHWPPLYYALKPCGHVQQGAPALLQSSAGDLYALEITMIAEE